MTTTRLKDEDTRLREKPAVPSWALKVVMAISGLMMAGFVVVHMVGNLKVYLPHGDEHINEYAIFLRTILEPALGYEGLLWIFRIGLLTAVIAHMVSAAILTKRARESRGKHTRTLSGFKNFVARSMPVTGIVLICFIVFHMLDLTMGVQPIASDSFQHIHETASGYEASAYDNVIASFQRPAVAIWYIIAMVSLSLHILHGIGTAAVDLGASNKKLRAAAVWLGWLMAAALLIGNTSIPFAVMIGLLS